jgi:CRP-like cAMP-binding protein
MELNEKRAVLGQVEIFARCKRGDVKTLARAAQAVEYAAGQTLCRQGERGLAMFVVVEGRVRIVEELEGGNQVTVGQLGPNAAVGEMAVLDGEERTATVVADVPTTCLTLTAWDLKAIIRDRPGIAIDILATVVRRFRETATELRRLRRETGGGA